MSSKEIPVTNNKYAESSKTINGNNQRYLIHEAEDSPSLIKIETCGDSDDPMPVSSLDLVLQDIEPKKPCVERLIPLGVSFLGGAPKSAKTILATQISLAVGSGQKLFGSLETDKTEVLMLSLEDTKYSLHERLTSMFQIYPSSLSAKFMWKWGADFDHNVALLNSYLKHHKKTGLVVIDTFEKFCGTGKRNSYSADYSVIGEIKKMSDKHGIAVLIVHHIIKNIPKNWVSAFYGTHGVAGAADGIIFLDRPIGSQQGQLHFTGRGMPSGSLNLKLNEQFLVWEMIQNGPNIHLNPERREIFDLLDSTSEMRLQDIAQTVGKSKTGVQNLLDKMLKLNIVVKTAHGVYAVSPRLKSSEPEKSMEAVETVETDAPTAAEAEDLVDSVENTSPSTTDQEDLMDAVDTMEITT
jgi:hypothetical protein